MPSVVVPAEYNYLINPRHADVDKLRIGPSEPLRPDFRLLKEEDTKEEGTKE